MRVYLPDHYDPKLYSVRLDDDGRSIVVAPAQPGINSASTKLPTTCAECVLICICGDATVLGDSNCVAARSQLRAGA